MPNLDHLSYSSLSHYLLCGYSWRLHYLDKVPVPTAPALVVGSAFHDVAESYIKTGDNLETLWQQSFDKQLERNTAIAWGDVPDPDAAKAALCDDGLRMVKAKPVAAMLSAIRGNYDPETCCIEKRVELRVPGVPIPIIGYIDVITKDGIPGDFKTAARMWSDGKADGELQPLFYLAALNQEGYEVPNGTFRHYVFTKTSRPDAKVFEIQHKFTEVFWLFQMIQAAWRGIEAGVFPMNPTGWKCSERYCDYWAMCRGKNP
jgi:hypothetical protein